MTLSKYEARKHSKSTAAYNAVVITSIVFLIVMVIFFSSKGNGDNERERSLRVILQCWKTAGLSESGKNGTTDQIQKCEQMERAYRKAHGSSLG